MLLAPLAVLSLCAAAEAFDVVLQVNGDGSVVVSGAEISASEDLPPRTQGTLRTGRGQETEVDSGGTTVAKVLRLAELPPEIVREASVARNGSPGSVVMSQSEIINGFTGDAKGRREATIYTGDGSRVRFFRPLRDADDVNVRDVFDKSDGPLRVAVTTTSDERRDVSASVDDDTPDPDQAVHFSAALEGATGGATFTWSWDFGDGGSGSTQTPDAHRYQAGAYRATVTAVGSDGSVGVATVPVQVGRVDARPTASPSATSTADGPSAGGGGGGPGSGGGEDAGGGTGNPDQAATGRRKRTPGRADRSSDAGVRGDPSPQPTPSASPSPAATTGATPAPGATPGTTPRQPSAGASPGDRPRRRRAPDQPVTAPDGEAVDGVLLAGSGSAQEVADLLATPAAEAESAARQSRRGGGGSSVLGWLAGGGALILLLAGGALRETGTRLPAAVRARLRDPRTT